MTMSCSQIGRATGSQVFGIASNPEDIAWNVNFNNGNSWRNNRNNQARVLAVCSPASECQDAQVSYKDLFQAWQKAKRGKVPSLNQARWEQHWMTNLLQLKESINAGTWKPRKTMLFMAMQPKAREIHAPDFEDRIVHHWLFPILEGKWEPTFIHDSYANRRGKGTHKAVDRVRQLVCQVFSGQGGGWYLQLDIKNCYNTINRRKLWAILKDRMERDGVPMIAQRVLHAMIRKSVGQQGVIYCATPAERAAVPPHKRLENAAPDCGMPIGNLISQFLANVYLDKLDQFAKRVLKVNRYVRYVDDFVLFHRDRAQLEIWLKQIEAFLRDELGLELKADIRLRPISSGIDFLGYVVYPTHTRVRHRVVRHANAALTTWSKQHISADGAHGTPKDFERIQSVLASYDGHFKHANAYRLRQLICGSHPWIQSFHVRRKFSSRLYGKQLHLKLNLNSGEALRQRRNNNTRTR